MNVVYNYVGRSISIEYFYLHNTDVSCASLRNNYLCTICQSLYLNATKVIIRCWFVFLGRRLSTTIAKLYRLLDICDEDVSVNEDVYLDQGVSYLTMTQVVSGKDIKDSNPGRVRR